MTTAASYSNLVQELYVAYFGRPADYYGLQNFEAALAAANAPTDPASLAAAYSTNAAVKSLVDSFGTSAESTALYGSGSTESFVSAIFENLFNRAAAVSGLAFWVDAINSGEVTKGDAALAILAGAEPASNSSSQAAADWALVQAKVTVATNFTTALGTSSTQIVDYSGSTAAQDARLMLAGVTAANVSTFSVQTTINNIVAGNTQHTYNLTTGVDTIVGAPGNNAFNAILDNTAGLAAGGQPATLQSFDSITGGTLNNTLNITDFGTGSAMAIPSNVTLTGITALNINTLESVSDNFSAWTDLTALNINNADGSIAVTVPDATVVNIDDTAGTLTITGGSIITAKTNVSQIIVNGGTSTTEVSLTGGISNMIIDAHYGTGNANSITAVSLTTNGGSGSATYTTIESDALTMLSLTSKASGVYVEAAAGTRTLTVDLDNDGPGYNGSVGAWVRDNTATTFDVNATDKASSIDFQAVSATSFTFNDAANLTLTGFDAPAAKVITITGAGDFNASFANSSLTSVAADAAIDATGASGVVTVTLDGGGGLSFTGGTGQDIVSIGATQTGVVTGGSNSQNEIILNNAGTATVTDIASATHFSIFGVNGNTQGEFDMSKVSGYDAYDVQGAGGNVTFTNVANNSTLSIDANDIGGYAITMQTADASGATDSATVNLGINSAVPTVFGGTSVSEITLEDASFLGMANVTINTAACSSEMHYLMDALRDSNIVSLNLTGSGNLLINNLNIVSTSLTITSDIAGHSSISAGLQALVDNNLTTLTIDGADGLAVGALVTTETGMTIVDNSKATVAIINLEGNSLTSATFTNTVNTASAFFAINDGSTLTETALATLNLNGNVTIGVVDDTVDTGITVAGSTDNAQVTINFNEATASGSTDSITLGNADGDSVTLGAGLAGSTQTVVLGTGAGDSIVTTSAGTVNATIGSATSGTDSITANSALIFHATAGNGTNTISDTATGATINISAGTGADSVTVGNLAGGTIALGVHAATTADTVSVGASGTSLTVIEKISGLNNDGADTLVFSGDANALSFTQMTRDTVIAAGGNTTLLAGWVAAADGLGGVVTGAAHTVVWFQFEGNTYLLESVAGQTTDAGTMAMGNTLVELTGAAYTFAHTTGAGGVVHLLG